MSVGLGHFKCFANFKQIFQEKRKIREENPEPRFPPNALMYEYCEDEQRGDINSPTRWNAVMGTWFVGKNWTHLFKQQWLGLIFSRYKEQEQKNARILRANLTRNPQYGFWIYWIFFCALSFRGKKKPQQKNK